MGNLADTFIVRLKPEFKEPNIEQIMPLIPKPYQQMFCILWDHFYSLEHILDSRNLMNVLDMIEDSDMQFDHRYHGECLQQILRRNFFNTLLIIQNVYSPDKRNVIHVLREGEALDVRAYQKWYSDRTVSGKPKWRLAFPVEDIISEEEWAQNKSEDEIYCHGVKKDLEAQGFQVHTEDHI